MRKNKSMCIFSNKGEIISLPRKYWNRHDVVIVTGGGLFFAAVAFPSLSPPVAIKSRLHTLHCFSLVSFPFTENNLP